MRVVEVAKFGGPEVLELKTVPDPAPGPGEVLIEVAAAGVLSVDMTIRSGYGAPYFPVQPPYRPGAGVTGIVQAVGDEVPAEWVGRRVLTGVQSGGYASHAVAPVAGLIPVPDNLGFPEAMALLHDGSTALALLEETPVESGSRILVQPAAGALGILLVQLLRAKGAEVIGAARGDEKLALVKEFGAEPVDYSNPDWTTRVGEVDVAFDGVGGDLGAAALTTVRQGGRFSNFGNASGSPALVSSTEVSIRGMDQLATFHPDHRRRTEYMLAEVAAGRIKPVISRTYPLEQAAEAHRALAARKVPGKSLLIP